MTDHKPKLPKVFGIGFHKTATTSLAESLKILGYRVTGPNGIDNPRIAQEAWPMSVKLADQFDAFQDNPWPLLFRELDCRFPGSKFILTLRPTEEWLRSVVKHFGRKETPMRLWIYGAGHPEGHEEIYAARYEKHNRDVTEYFKHRPQDLLEMNITKGDGWEKLCPFLETGQPNRPFPRANTAVQRESKANPFARLLKLVRNQN